MLVSIRSIPVALLSLAMATGCVASGHTRAVKTADRLDNLSSALEEVRASVNSSATTLSALVAKKGEDPTLTFQQFEDAVQSLKRARKRVDGHLAGVRTDADAYFNTWKEQAATINDEDLKERSEERRVELSEAVDRVTEAVRPACEKVDTYMASLHDTLKYLSIDLSPQGIASIDGRAKAAAKSAKSIDESMNDVLETVKKAAPLFASARSSTTKRSAPAAGEPPAN